VTHTRAFRACDPNDVEQTELLYGELAMTIRPDPDAVAAMQYLMWALEFIEKTADRDAAHHVRLALEALRKRLPRSTDTGEYAP
jgi:hypothetical protein